jgi:hypothetical protein
VEAVKGIPKWGWVLAAVAFVGVFWYSSRAQSASASPAPDQGSAASSPASGGALSPGDQALQAQIAALQDYLQGMGVTPPDNGPGSPPGPTGNPNYHGPTTPGPRFVFKPNHA